MATKKASGARTGGKSKGGRPPSAARYRDATALTNAIHEWARTAWVGGGRRATDADIAYMKAHAQPFGPSDAEWAHEGQARKVLEKLLGAFEEAEALAPSHIPGGYGEILARLVSIQEDDLPWSIAFGMGSAKREIAPLNARRKRFAAKRKKPGLTDLEAFMANARRWGNTRQRRTLNEVAAMAVLAGLFTSEMAEEALRLAPEGATVADAANALKKRLRLKPSFMKELLPK